VPDSQTNHAGPAAQIPASADKVKTVDAKQPWLDLDIPAGDSPPMPRWPLIVSILAWCGWMIFLVAMMIQRLHSSAI
jgi:hypothetical protein